MTSTKMESLQDKRLADLKSVKEKEYGPFSSSMNKIAAAWNIILKDKLRLEIRLNSKNDGIYSRIEEEGRRFGDAAQSEDFAG